MGIHKARLLFFLNFFVPLLACSQSISGKIFNENANPLSYVTVIFKVNSKVVSTQITDSSGNFNYNGTISNNNLPVSVYFSRIGYLSMDTTVTTAGTLNLNITLKVNLVELKAVSVTNRKPVIERKVDRLVFNIENNVNTAGLDIYEVIGKTPLVRVYNDVISIVGKESADVLYNGKPLHLTGEALKTFLRSIHSEQIERIEVITNPPSQYDPTGNGGLINIVTKKIRSVGYWVSSNASFAIAKSNVARLGINFNYNKKDLRLFANLTTGIGANNSIYRDDIYYSQFTWQQEYLRKEFSKYINGSAGFELQMSKRTTLSSSYNRLTSYPDDKSSINVNYLSKATSLVDSALRSDVFIDKLYIANSINVHLNHQLDTTEKVFKLDFDYYNNRFDNKNNNASVTVDSNGTDIPKSTKQFLSVNNRNAEIYSITGEFNIPLRTIKYTYGGKVSYMKTLTSVKMFTIDGGNSIPDNNNTNDFKVSENIQALFFNATKKISKKVEVQAGIRTELTEQKAVSPTLKQTNTKTYFSLFPTSYVKYEADKKNVFSLSSGRRFNRPNFSLLNPYRIYDNLFSYSEGNPGLKAYYSNNFELTHTYNNFLYYTLSYSKTTNSIRYITLIDDATNIQVQKPYNYITSQDYALVAGFSFDKITWLMSSNEASVYYSRVSSKLAATASTLSGWGGDFRSTNSIFFNKKRTLTGGIDLTYQAGYLSGIVRNKQYCFLDLTFRYSIPKKQLQFMVAARDILNSKNIRWTEFVNGITKSSFMNSNTRRISVTVNYSFGDKKVKAGNIYSAAGEEKGRVN